MRPRQDEHCYRCGHVWTPRRSRVRICARCKSPYFWLPKIRVATRGSGLGVKDVIGPNRNKVLRLARRYGATNVRVFGSVARSEATVDSDIDLLVDPIREGEFRPIDLALALTRALGRRVDLVRERSLVWLVQPQVVAEAVPL
jgi:predicted nucleotidyltransferase